jgi:hypothetical protein
MKTEGRMSRKLGPLAALAVAALIGVGCSNEPAENGNAGNTNADYENLVKFSECMRDSGVSEFPDPDASGGLTIDRVLNGSSLDPRTPAWQNAIAACKDLQPPGFTGDEEVTAEEQGGAPRVRPVHARQRRGGLPGPRTEVSPRQCGPTSTGCRSPDISPTAGRTPVGPQHESHVWLDDRVRGL